MESSAMKEIRKIRDENAERHLAMTKEEQKAELDSAVSWLIAATKKDGRG